jgi:ABC-type lipoprotein release transport system permease subunit
MKLEQPSTQRGLIWAICGIASLALIFLNREEDVKYAMAIGATIAGSLGVVVDDKIKTIVINKGTDNGKQ